MAPVEDQMDGPMPLNSLQQRLADAELLLDYALQKGTDVGVDIIDGIRAIVRNPNDDDKNREERGERSPAFDEAYRDLAAKMAPVTATTLRDTDAKFGRRLLLNRRSVAERWSASLWAFTLSALAFIGSTELLQELLANWYPLDPDLPQSAVQGWHLYLVGANILLPFIYGLLGACLYLLPKCHEFVTARTFDRLRIAQYKSRLLLGFAAGGIVMFFVYEIGVGEGDEVVQLSAPVLAIIAGYNTDFLFQAIQRMVAAILPKVGISSAKPAAPPPPTVRSVSVEALAKALNDTDNEEDKKSIRAAIAAATKRL